MSTANTTWTIAYDAAEEQQTANDATSLAGSVVDAAGAQITAATLTIGASQNEFTNDMPDEAAFDKSVADARLTELNTIAGVMTNPAEMGVFVPLILPPIASARQAAQQTIDPLSVTLAQQVDGQAVVFATARANANKGLTVDEAGAAYTLAWQEADHARGRKGDAARLTIGRGDDILRRCLALPEAPPAALSTTC